MQIVNSSNNENVPITDPVNNQTVVSPDIETTYTLRAWYKGIAKSRSAKSTTVLINTSSSRPKIVTFTTEYRYLVEEETTLLSWIVEDGYEQVVLSSIPPNDAGPIDVTEDTKPEELAFYEVSPREDTVYTLTARNGNETVRKSVKVIYEPAIIVKEEITTTSQVGSTVSIMGLSTTYLAAYHSNKVIDIFDASTKTQITTLEASPFTMALHPQEPHVAFVYDDKIAEIFDINTKNKVSTLTHTKLGIRALAYSPDGERLTIGSTLGQIYTWDIRNASNPTIIIVQICTYSEYHINPI